MKKITLLLFILTSSLGYSQPTTSAPVPTRLQANVISVYGEGYTNVATNYNPNWGQTGFCCVNPAFNPVEPATGNLVLAYPNFNYQGTELTTQNAAIMEFLHVDVWTNANPANTTLQVSPINGGNGATGAAETLVTINYTQNGWYSVDIPKASFTGMTWNSVFQMKFAANGQGSTVPVTIYLDNIYFWKTPTAAGTDATLSDLKVDGTTITGYGAGTLSYDIVYPAGTTAIPQITSATTTDPMATRVITQATALPGSATVLVTSQNTLVTRTYTVNYSVILVPTVAAPIPPVLTRPQGTVKSIYSNSYTPVTTFSYAGDSNSYNTPWCPVETSEFLIGGAASTASNRATLMGSGLVVGNTTTVPIYVGSDLNGACEGIDFLGGRFDATAFTHLHIDIWTPIRTMALRNITIKIVNFNAANTGESNANIFNISTSSAAPNQLPSADPNPLLAPGAGFLSFDISLNSFTNAGTAPGGIALARDNIAQMVLGGNLGTVYYDNLYFWGAPLSTNDFSANSVKLYPNPATNVLNIESTSMIEKVSVYNLLGQEVISQTPNSELVTLDVASLQVGVYVVKTSIDGNITSTRFIKE